MVYCTNDESFIEIYRFYKYRKHFTVWGKVNYIFYFPRVI